MKLFLIIGAAAMALAVLLGAFGAHGLKQRLAPDLLAVYQTGVEYHFYHALGLLLIGLIGYQWPQAAGIKWSGWFMVAGMLLFSGSLYILALTGVRWLGAITPLGGVAFILGWVSLCWALINTA